MSLDALFTEAAEAGGPPGFTEDDIAQRVGERHRRRRRVATGAAVLVVLGGAGLGVYLAGEGEDPAPVVGPAEIPAVPIDREAVMGQWRLVPGPGAEPDSAPPTLDLLADGRYRVEGCLEATGGWTVTAGRLGLGPGEYLPLNGCGSAVSGLLTAFPTGATTLYADDLLRFATVEHTVDFVRADDASPPDATTARTDPFRTIPADVAGVTGRWISLDGDVAGASLPFLDVDQSGSASFEHCNAGRATWSIRDGRIAFDDIAESTLRNCVAVDEGSMYLERILGFGADLTSDGLMVVPGPAGAFFLQRDEGVDPTPDPTSDAELTGDRWVATGPIADYYPLVPWIEFVNDGSVNLPGCRSAVDGWTEGEDGITLDRGDDVDVSCASPNDEAQQQLGDLVGVRRDADGLVITYDRGEELTFQRLGDIGEPLTEDELLGEWSTALVADGSGATRTKLSFSNDGTVVLGYCPAVPWHLADDRLTIDAAADTCVAETGISPLLIPSTVRIDGDMLYLSGQADWVAVLHRGDQHLNDTSISVSGPGPSLQDAYADVGVEPCCQENGDGLVRRGFVWEGHEVGVEALVLADALDELGLDGATVELDGQVVSGRRDRGTELAFDCGGYRFAVYAWADSIPDDVLLDAASALLAALPCRAIAPT